jgi:general stress protein 26
MKRIVLICLFLVASTAMAGEACDLIVKPNKDPIQEFSRWQQFAKGTNTKLLNIAALATVDSNQFPQQRHINISTVDENGFVFPTHSYTSKVKHLTKNKKASLIFLWHDGKQFLQVRVVGEVEKSELAKTRSTRDNIHHEFYSYVLKPNFIQFALVDKSKDVIEASYLNYVLTPKGDWEMQPSHHAFSKVK